MFALRTLGPAALAAVKVRECSPSWKRNKFMVRDHGLGRDCEMGLSPGVLTLTALPNGLEKLLELFFISCLFFTNIVLYEFSLRNRKDCLFSILMHNLTTFCLKGNQNSLKNTLFGYYYFFIWTHYFQPMSIIFWLLLFCSFGWDF